MKFRPFLLLLAFLISAPIYAQTEQPEPPSQNLDDQYKYLIENTESYNDFKVIRESRLNEFWAVVQDSVGLLKGQIAENEQQIILLQDEIASLKATMEDNQAAVDAAEFDRAHIQFLGIDFSKTLFITITLLIVFGLMLLLLVGSFQYNHNKRVAKQKLDDYNDLENRYEEFRKSTLEKQIKLKRELQTERNKLEEIQSKTTIRKKIPA